MDGTSARAVLGLTPDAPTHDVKTAYRTLVKRAHPDGGGDARTFAELTEAYRIARRCPSGRPPCDRFLRASHLAAVPPLVHVRRPRPPAAPTRSFAEELSAALSR